MRPVSISCRRSPTRGVRRQREQHALPLPSDPTLRRSSMPARSGITGVFAHLSAFPPDWVQTAQACLAFSAQYAGNGFGMGTKIVRIRTWCVRRVRRED